MATEKETFPDGQLVNSRGSLGSVGCQGGEGMSGLDEVDEAGCTAGYPVQNHPSDSSKAYEGRSLVLFAGYWPSSQAASSGEGEEEEEGEGYFTYSPSTRINPGENTLGQWDLGCRKSRQVGWIRRKQNRVHCAEPHKVATGYISSCDRR